MSQSQAELAFIEKHKNALPREKVVIAIDILQGNGVPLKKVSGLRGIVYIQLKSICR